MPINDTFPVDNTTHQFLIGLVERENEKALKRYMKAEAKYEAYRKISKQYKGNEQALRRVGEAYSKKQIALDYLEQMDAAYQLVVTLCELDKFEKEE